MAPSGRIEYFVSQIDGVECPCAVCATDTGDDPKPLVIEVSPGALTNLPRCVALTEQIAGWAEQHGRSCIVLRPTGRGDGSVYQNYGEVDVFEAIEHVKAHYAVDTDRISVTGASMGGAATWYLISHYPDVFTAAAPFCGYCDYRLWKKPGGSTFQIHEWEEPSWISRSAAFLIENLRYTPMWIVHGEWDRSVGGGVDVEQSRQMARLCAERGYDVRYIEVPATGHRCRTPEIFEEAVLWLLDHKKDQAPRHIVHAAYTLRHNRSHWVSIDQLTQYGAKGIVDAAIQSQGGISVSTHNVSALSLLPLQGGERADVTIDESVLPGIDLTLGSSFHKDERGRWLLGPNTTPTVKRHGASGPLSDLFFDGVILVPGTCGSPQETHVARDCARQTVKFFAERNGGVHRGGIMGENSVSLPIVEDMDISDTQLGQYNLILFGTPASNRVFARLRDRLPVSFAGDTIQLSDRQYTAEGCAGFAAFPNPANPGRYVAVHGSTAPDGICWGSHLDMQLLPDYIVYAREQLLDWGFWNSDWKAQG